MRTVFILSAFILISLTDSAWSQTPEPIGFGISIVRETDPKIGMAHVVSVDPGSDAEKAGVKPGDIITSVDTPPIEDGHPKTTVHLHHADAPKPIIVALQDNNISLPIPQKVEMVTFGGIGLVIQDVNGSVKVFSAVENDPAAKAGVKAGDTILAVDGKSIAENALNADSTTGLVRGTIGTVVRLTVQHDGEAKPVTLAITRVAITVAKPRAAKPPVAAIPNATDMPAPIDPAQVASTPAPQDKTLPSSGTITTVSPEALSWLGWLYATGKLTLVFVAFAIAAKMLKRLKTAAALLAIPNVLFLLAGLYFLIRALISVGVLVGLSTAFIPEILIQFATYIFIYFIAGVVPFIGAIAALKFYKHGQLKWFVAAVIATLVTAVTLIAAFFSLAYLAASGL